MRPGPQLARDAQIGVFSERTIHLRNGRTEVGISLEGVLAAVAWPTVDRYSAGLRPRDTLAWPRRHRPGDD